MIALIPELSYTFMLYHVGKFHIDGFMQNCSKSITNALELLRSCTKPSIYKGAYPKIKCTIMNRIDKHSCECYENIEI